MFGMEIEFFLRKKDEFLYPLDFGLGHDGFPLLGEIRSEPDNDPYRMAGEVTDKLNKARVMLSGKAILYLNPQEEITSELFRKTLRRPEINKTPNETLNLYGNKLTQTNPLIVTAGIHIHFSKHTVVKTNICKLCNTYSSTNLYQQQDIPNIIRFMDKEFEHEIKSTNRVAGDYKLKNYGFEYRSLPNSVNLWKIADVLSRMKA